MNRVILQLNVDMGFNNLTSFYTVKHIMHNEMMWGYYESDIQPYVLIHHIIITVSGIVRYLGKWLAYSFGLCLE